MVILIPQDVQFIMKKLLDSGYKAHIVGGSVRDQLLGQPVSDYDITTSATPDQIIEVFKSFKTMKFGAKHGTISVIYKRKMYEITTYRIESEYSDGRRPDSVEFVKDLHKDLARRDFTINAMAATIDGNIVDPYNGIKDIKQKIIRAVGIPFDRFSEDSLRILRAYRFSLRFNFTIDKDTTRAIIDTNHLINEHKITGERIGTEMKEILSHSFHAIELMQELGTLQIIIPIITDNDCAQAIQRLQTVDTHDIFIILAVLLYEPSKRDSNIYKLWKNTFKRIKGLGKYNELRTKFLLEYGEIPDSILLANGDAELLRWIDKYTHNLIKKKDFNWETEINGLITYASAIRRENLSNIREKALQCRSKIMDKLPVNGNDVKELGYYNKKISKVLRLWKYCAWYLNFTVKDEFINFILNLQSKKSLSENEIRMLISNNNPKNTPEEDSVVDEFNELLNFIL